MKNILTILIILLAFNSFSQSNQLPKISVKENSFVASGDKPFIFRGLNIADPLSLKNGGHWNKSFFEEIKKWGANVVRIPVHPISWKETGKEGYLKLLDEAVQWAESQALYVIIDWHSIGNLCKEIFPTDRYKTSQKETFEFWGTMSNHYKGNNTVAFFELFNEPTTNKGQLGACSWADWKKINEEMIGIIHANGGTAIPLVAGFDWAYDLTEIAKNPINAAGIGYVAHPYPMKRQKPWEAQWTNDWGYVKDKYPLILTEIGFALKNEVGAHIPVIDDGTYGDAITKYCDKNGISWVVWIFDKSWAPPMFSDWNYTPTTQGAYFKKALLERQGK